MLFRDADRVMEFAESCKKLAVSRPGAAARVSAVTFNAGMSNSRSKYLETQAQPAAQ